MRPSELRVLPKTLASLQHSKELHSPLIPQQKHSLPNSSIFSFLIHPPTNHSPRFSHHGFGTCNRRRDENWLPPSPIHHAMHRAKPNIFPLRILPKTHCPLKNLLRFSGNGQAGGRACWRSQRPDLPPITNGTSLQSAKPIFAPLAVLPSLLFVIPYIPQSMSFASRIRDSKTAETNDQKPTNPNLPASKFTKKTLLNRRLFQWILSISRTQSPRTPTLFPASARPGRRACYLRQRSVARRCGLPFDSCISDKPPAKWNFASAKTAFPRPNCPGCAFFGEFCRFLTNFS